MSGGATGVVQGPDTDLHAWLEKELTGLQEASTSAQLSVRPRSTPSENRQSIVDYAIALWEMADHKQGSKSFKRNGVNNNLDGSEDYLITRIAREFWLELILSSKRAICEIEVEQFLDALGREPHVERCCSAPSAIYRRRRHRRDGGGRGIITYIGSW